MNKYVLVFSCFFKLLGFSQSIQIHVDRSYYSTPDTTWFRIRTPNNDNIIFVQLFQKQKLIEQKIINPIVPFGYFSMSDSLPVGEYRLIAFQQYKNQQVSICKKIITVVKSGQKIYRVPQSLSICFMPEGGNLVNGLSSVVGFLAKNQNSEAVNIEGEIIDSFGSIQAKFKTKYGGMGKFWFTPILGNIYYIKIKYHGALYEAELPKIEKSGVVLSAKYAEKDSMVTLTVSQKNIENRYASLLLKIYSSGSLIWERHLSAQMSNILKIPIFEENLYFEIWQDTILLAKRLVIAKQSSTFHVQVKTTTTNLASRQKITAEIYLEDKNNRPVQGEFSISITNANQQTESYLANEQSTTTFEKSDLLSLMYLYDLSFKQSIDTTLIIRGMVTNFITQKPVSQAKVIINYANSTKKIFEKTETNEQGKFSIQAPDIVDTLLVFVQATHKKVDKLNVKLEKSFVLLDSLHFLKNVEQKFEIKNVVETELNAQKDIFEELLKKTSEFDNITLNEVIIKSNKPNATVEQLMRQVENRLDGINIAMQTRRLFSNDQPQARTLGELLKIKIPEIFVKRDPIQIDGRIIPINSLVVGGSPAGFRPVFTYLDGNMVQDSGTLTSLLARDIATLVYYTPSLDNLPVLLIVSKHTIPNYDYSKDKVLGTIVARGLGFSTSKEFYSPKYENTNTNYRPTLYWNASVRTNKDGKATVTFYNSDIAKKLNIVVEGTDGLGNVGSGSFVVH